MFQSARLKLTVWYIIISMVVSVLFSIAIFSILHAQLVINTRRLEVRIERERELNPYFIPPVQMAPSQELETVENTIKLHLIYVNLLILAIASLAGYFLSGRTLKPIQEMVDTQNQFIADASHELRTPLTALKTAIEVNLRDQKMSLKQAKAVLNENLQDVNTLKMLSENLLTLVTLQQNSKGLFEKTSLKEVINTAVNRVSYLAREKKIKIATSNEEVTLSGDKQKLTDLLVIFLDNAIKYSDENKKISLTSKKSDTNALIEIADQGTGISDEDISHIFERFYQGDKSRSSQSRKGYGLGLAIAKEIVELHHGTIIVTSKAKKGTTFIVKLPIV